MFLTVLILLVPLASGGDRPIMVTILVGAYAFIIVMLYQIHLNYFKPTNQITAVLQELIKGNYSVRAYEKTHYNVDKLGYAVNKLAFNLQNLNRQDKMHSRQLLTVIDHMESGIMLLDTQGYVQLINRKFTDLFDKTEDEANNQLYYHVLKQKKIYHSAQKVFLYEETIRNSIILEKDGQTLYIEIVAVPFFNESKELRGLVFVFHDITELKHVEQIRKDFVANVSHELKTPITSIKGFAETMLDDEIGDRSLQEKFLTIIYKESDRLQALIHDLLQLSKLERDEFDIELRRVDLSPLIEDSVTMVNDQAEKKGIHLILKVDNNLSLIGDEARLKQVMLNLLYNGINYTKENGTVMITAKRSNQWIEISVEDNGIGISREAIDRIFERFYRVDKARSRDTGGTGLGLAIVKHIVEAHKGSIEVESELNVGSTFKILLPAHK
ncbi:two-component system histidine kinase PnpS [Amphibacillus sp. Q70]|uniref:two-component system histidine kinase PnpS n=1 Tax=Amphibacillus sp. Q70 TaxID=3453416 RepID=UPI003F83DB7A